MFKTFLSFHSFISFISFKTLYSVQKTVVLFLLAIPNSLTNILKKLVPAPI